MNVKYVLRKAGYEPRSYSGAGMFGRKCVAVETTDPPAVVALYMARETDESDNLVAIFRGARQDQLGTGSILYFPTVSYDEDDDEDKD